MAEPTTVLPRRSLEAAVAASTEPSAFSLSQKAARYQRRKAAAILGISRQAVDKRRQAGTLLAISVGGHGYHCPAWHFDQSGVIGGLESVLKVLARHDEWMKFAFFVNANVHLKW